VTNPNAADKTLEKHLILGRNTLERATLLSARLRDENGFEKHFNQLRPYYSDYRALLTIESEKEKTLVGLNLLRLLSQNRIADFHTELQLIPIEYHSDFYIKYPVELEQWLMDGRYHKIAEFRGKAPAPSYQPFVETLLESLRDRIGECLEKAYESLPTGEAKARLFVDSDKKLTEFAALRNSTADCIWEISGGRIHFRAKKEDKPEIPALILMKESMHYARELERIV